MILVEEYTQASCGPCASANPTLNKLLFANENKVNFIKYQTNWPGTDPMNKQNGPDVDARAKYSQASSTGVPYITHDGYVYPKDADGYKGYPGHLTQAKIDAEYKIPSPFTMTLYHWFNGANDSVFIRCIVTCSDAVTMTTPKLQVALMEKTITFTKAPGSNGEKVFEHVMRKMYPSATGTVLVGSWTKGKTQTFDFKAAIPSYIYDKKQLATIAWIQDDTGQNIKQSAYNTVANYPTGIDAAITTLNLSAYPNPSDGLVKLNFESLNSSDYSVKITNAIGQVVYEEALSNFKGTYSKDLDLKKYGAGVYLLSVGSSKTQQIEKLIIY